MSEERLSLELLGEARAPAELPRQGKLVIGSSRERADLVVDGAGVDAVHCAIGRLKEGGWALKDLGSDGGSFVNGERVTSTRLRAGDVIVIGSRRLRVFDPRIEAATAAAPAPLPSSAAAASPEVERGRARDASSATPLPSTPSSRRGTSPIGRGGASSERGANGGAPLAIRGYSLERMLGRGAMGEVWLAVQQSLGRKVALKVLSPRLEADAEFVRRFQAEARAAAALSHPNVVTVHDVGEDGGHHYLTMEFMAHGCLESRVATLGPLPWRDVLGVLRDAAAGLVYAEQRGIVHRDIKPANLMQDEHGVTKIADLGLAAQVEQEEVQGERGKVFGTPHFLAPELIRGAPPDPRSDLYALGATAYRLLTGRTPFEGATPRDILRAALRDEPPAPSSLREGIPAEVERLVMRLLAKDPASRTPSASALLTDVERLRQSPSGAEASGRRRVAPLVALGVLVVGAVAVGAWTMQGGERGDDPGANGERASTRGDRSASSEGRNARASRDGDGDGDGTASAASDATSAGATGGSAPDAAGALASAPQEGAGDAPDGTHADGAGDATALEFGQREAAARARYDALANRVLDDVERVVLLRELARETAGTDVSVVAQREADALEARLASAKSTADPSAAARASVLAALRSALASAATGDLAKALADARAVPGQDALAADAAFLSERSRLEAEALASALDAARDAHARADELERTGRFDEYVKLLADWSASVTLPELPADATQPEAVREIASLVERARVRTSATELDAARARFAERQRVRDARAVAEAFGGSRGLEAELARLDVGAAIARVDAALAGVATAEARAELESLRRELANAREVLATLGVAWQRDEWRRKTVNDPRPRRGEAREAVRADAGGVWLASDSGPERIEWSAWGAQAAELDKLFHGRLERAWTPSEVEGIATLLRVAAVVALTRAADAALDPAVDDRFSESDAESARAAFAVTATWELSPAVRARAEREAAAAEILLRALQAEEEGAYSRAVAYLEDLLAEHPQSLLVLLRSDGSEWREPRADPVPAPAAGSTSDDVRDG